MRKTLVLLFILGIQQVWVGQTIKIGLWRDHIDTDRFYFMSEKPSTWHTDKKKVTLPGNKSIYFTYNKGLVRLSTADRNYGSFHKILLEEQGTYTLSSIKPIRTEEVYNHVLEVSIQGKSLFLINKFDDIEEYISGVVEAETGKEQNKEFYKVQATISRTFTLSNSRRHEAEGFHLCDQVHCQVYHGISRFNPDIILATEETEGEVLVDPEINLITASFHSNCGGITTNSEDVWSKSLPYLRSVRDTFCIGGVHSQWDEHIDATQWLNHISKQYALKLDGDDKNSLLEFASPQRERFLLYHNAHIERKELRNKWKLKSTFFNSTLEGNEIILNGRGHGHGVGLCQEGAMEMSRRGYNYEEILQFYYTDVHLVHRSMIDFFKE